MTTLMIPPPFKVWPDVDGEPLEDGSVYIGVAGMNPQSNPITVYFDSALTIPAAQPLRTLGGFIVNSGSPANIYASAARVSITVRNKNGTLVYTNLNVSVSEFSTLELNSVDELVNSRGLSSYGQLYIKSFNAITYPSLASGKGGQKVHVTGGTSDAPTVAPPVSPGDIGSGDQAGYYWDQDGVEWFIDLDQDINGYMFGITGDGSDQTNELTNALTFWQNHPQKPMYLGNRDDVILTSAEITLTFSVPFPGYVTLKGDGVTILNTTTNILTIYGVQHLMLMKGIRFIGSNDDYVTRNPNSGLRMDTLFNARIDRCEFSGFNTNNLLIARTLWTQVRWCVFQYGNTLCNVSNTDISGLSVSANVTEIKRCIFWNATTSSDVSGGIKTLPTDKCLTVLTSVNTRVIQCTFEFPQEHGIRFNRNRAALVQSCYFEHGTGGFDILCDGTSDFNDYATFTQNHHNAGSGDGGTPGGHSPFSSSGTIIQAWGNNALESYDPANLDPRYMPDQFTTVTAAQMFGTVDIVARDEVVALAGDYRLKQDFCTTDRRQDLVFSRERSLPATTLTPICEVDAFSSANFSVILTVYNGRNTNGTGGGVSRSVATYFQNSGTLSEVNALSSSTLVGTPFTVSSSVLGSVVTFSVNNGTGNTHYCHYTLEIKQALPALGIRCAVTAL